MLWAPDLRPKDVGRESSQLLEDMKLQGARAQGNLDLEQGVRILIVPHKVFREA